MGMTTIYFDGIPDVFASGYSRAGSPVESCSPEGIEAPLRPVGTRSRSNLSKMIHNADGDGTDARIVGQSSGQRS